MASPSIPEEQWAQVVDKVGGQDAVPQPGPDEVLVHVEYSGVCHSDLHLMLGELPMSVPKLPLVGGHEGTGVVVARGAHVHDMDVGDGAGIQWLGGSCLSCAFCTQGDEMLCPRVQLSGGSVDGSFQQYAVAKATHVARLPRDCDRAAVAPILCAGVTVYKGLRESGARPGQLVAVVGAGGGLGSLAIQYARAMGLDVIAVDTGDQKRDMCLALGARAFVDFQTAADLVADVKAAAPDGRGPHVVLLVATREEPFRQAVDYVRSRGTIVCMGLPPSTMARAPVFDMVIRIITIKGSYIGNRVDTSEALEFFRKGLIKAPYNIVGLSELQDVYDLMSRGETAGRYVVDTSK